MKPNTNELVALINPSEQHQGYPGRMHGGIAATILDEIIARSICNGKNEQLWGVTLELKTKFRKPVPLDQELKIVGRVTSEGSRLLKVPVKLFSQTGKSQFLPKENILRQQSNELQTINSVNNEWYLAESPDDPSEIDIP